MKKRKKAIIIRRRLMVTCILLAVIGLAVIAWACGGLGYGMPAIKGAKQITLGGVLLGIGAGGCCAIGRKM